MSITKKMFFRLVPRSKVRRFSLTYRFKLNEPNQKDFKNLNLQKILRLKKIKLNVELKLLVTKIVFYRNFNIRYNT